MTRQVRHALKSGSTLASDDAPRLHFSVTIGEATFKSRGSDRLRLGVCAARGRFGLRPLLGSRDKN